MYYQGHTTQSLSHQQTEKASRSKTSNSILHEQNTGLEWEHNLAILPGGCYQWFIIPTFNEEEGDINDGTGWITRTEIQTEGYDDVDVYTTQRTRYRSDVQHMGAFRAELHVIVYQEEGVGDVTV